MKHEALLREFIQRHGLAETMKEPLETLFQSWLEQMSQTLDPALEAALMQKASWQPVSLSESGHDTSPTPAELPQVQPKRPALLPPKPPGPIDVSSMGATDDEDDPIIYATLDAPTDKFPALDASQTWDVPSYRDTAAKDDATDAFTHQPAAPTEVLPTQPVRPSQGAPNAQRQSDLHTEKLDLNAPTPTSSPPIWTPDDVPAQQTTRQPSPVSPLAPATKADGAPEQDGASTPAPGAMEAEPSTSSPRPTPLPPGLGLARGNAAELKPPQDGEQPPQAERLLAANVSHYTYLSRIAVGGMSEILRVQDRDLNRIVAMKVMKPDHKDDPILLSRFLEEAQVTAQLEHPGIIPVYDFGRLSDGRFYFTMKEIKGTSLTEVIRRIHETTHGETWGTTDDGWHLWRLLDGFKRVCEAIGFAHSHRVVHRDLKPENIVVGHHGEVLVVDWGLVKLLPLHQPPEAKEKPEEPPSRQPRGLTMQGDLIGTPAYMPPEQLTNPDQANERNDVYSLGAILYEMLAGQAPYVGYNKNAIVFQMMSGPPYPPGRTEAGVGLVTSDEADAERAAPWNTAGELPSYATDKPPLPEGLIAICAKAMSRDPDERYTNAGELAAVIGEWLTGSKDRRRALQVVAEAEDRFPETWLLRTRARQLRKEAEREARRLEPWDPEESKWPIWELEDQAAELQREARQLELETEQLLKGALTHFPDLEEAHEALAIRYQKSHQHAEAEDDQDAAIRHELQLREHIQALPESNLRKVELLEYLQGDGALTLLTEPPGATVKLYRLEEQRRRQREIYVADIGTSPIKKHILPMGSYLLTLHADGYQPIRYPIHIKRGEHWRSIHPMTKRTQALFLPPEGYLTPDEVLIPGGMAWLGGDPDLPDALPGQKIWIDDFVMKKHHVTNAEYQEFMGDLVAQRRGDLLALFAPQDNTTYSSDESALFAAGSNLAAAQMTQKDLARIAAPPDWPVIKVTWFGAMAYAGWLSQKTGQTWRLPFELEWEKAARGVDRRIYPWGHRFDPSWAHVRDSLRGENTPTSVGLYPVDTSIYGVRHMAGNAMDWCLDTHTRDGPPVVNRTFQRDQAWEQSLPHDLALSPEHTRKLRRGGAWSSTGQAIRVTYRHWSDPNAASSAVGFRLVRPYKPHG